MIEKTYIRQVLIDQKAEIQVLLAGKLVRRAVVSDVMQDLSSDQIKVITGVRRCGKSVLAHMLLSGKKYAYANFDDERLIDVTAKDLLDFSRSFAIPFIYPY